MLGLSNRISSPSITLASITLASITLASIKRLLGAITLLAIASGCASSTSTASVTSHPVLELRTYTTHDGKLDALHSRFRDHTQALFEAHGIKNLSYWTPIDKPNTLIYLIGHESREAAARSWKAFVADPRWQAAYAASREDGPLVANIESVFMQATDYSPR